MHLFTTYFLGPKLTSATQLYGVLGVTTTLLFWFYLAGRLIIAAATLNTSYSERRALTHAPTPQTVAPARPPTEKSGGGHDRSNG